MKLILDNEIFPPRMTLYDNLRYVKHSSEVGDISTKAMEILDNGKDGFNKIKFMRLVHKAIQVFEPTQIIIEEK